MSPSLLDVITACASSDVNMMKEATKALESMCLQPTYLIDLLKVVATPDASQSHVVLHAAIIFKNDVLKRWDLPACSGGFSDEVKKLVRENILSIHLGLARKPQRQILQAIYLISLNDFPFVWPTLFSELQALLVTAQPQGRALIIEVMREVCQRYVTASSEDTDTLLELKNMVLPALFANESPLNIVTLASEAVTAMVNGGLSADEAKLVASVAEACVAIQTAILNVDLAEQIEDALPSCVPLFTAALKFSANHLPGLASRGFEAGPLDTLQQAVLGFFTTLVRRFPKESEQFLSEMANGAFSVVHRVGDDESGDALVAAGVELLSTIARNQWKPAHDPFQDAQSMVPLLIDRVVLPCVLLRPCDVELFEERPAEFVVRDLEQGDEETRRRAGLDLVRSLLYPRLSDNSARSQIVTQYLLGKVESLMKSPETDVRAREGAVCLVSALAGAEESRTLGVTRLNPALPFEEVLSTLVLPVLAAPQAASTRPMLSCACLRFVALYRQQITAAQRIELASVVGQHLSVTHATVRAYAAHALERLIFALQSDQANASQFVALVPLALRSASEEGGDLPQDPEAMRLLWRTLAFLGDAAQPHIEACMSTLCGIASRLPTTSLSQGTSPKFIQFTFESLAVLVALLGRMTDGPHAAGAIGLVNSKLFPCMLSLLQSSEQDFASYALQVLQVVLTTCQNQACASLSEQLGGFVPSLLDATFFERTRAHSAAVASLLGAFLERADMHPFIAPRLGDVLQRAKFCLLTRTLEPAGFTLIQTVIRCMPQETWTATYLTPIIKELLGRLLGSKQNVDIRARVMLSFSILIASFNGDASVLASQLEGVKPGLGANVFLKMWLPTLSVYKHKNEKKIVTLALLAALRDQRFFDPATVTHEHAMLVVNGLAHLFLITGVDTTVSLEWCNGAITDASQTQGVLEAARLHSGLEQIVRAGKETEQTSATYEASFKRLVSSFVGKKDLFPSLTAAHVLMSLKSNGQLIMACIQKVSTSGGSLSDADKTSITHVSQLMRLSA